MPGLIERAKTSVKKGWKVVQDKAEDVLQKRDGRLEGEINERIALDSEAQDRVNAAKKAEKMSIKSDAKPTQKLELIQKALAAGAKEIELDGAKIELTTFVGAFVQAHPELADKINEKAEIEKEVQEKSQEIGEEKGTESAKEQVEQAIDTSKEIAEKTIDVEVIKKDEKLDFKAEATKLKELTKSTNPDKKQIEELAKKLKEHLLRYPEDVKLFEPLIVDFGIEEYLIDEIPQKTEVEQLQEGIDQAKTDVQQLENKIEELKETTPKKEYEKPVLTLIENPTEQQQAILDALNAKTGKGKTIEQATQEIKQEITAEQQQMQIELSELLDGDIFIQTNADEDAVEEAAYKAEVARREEMDQRRKEMQWTGLRGLVKQIGGIVRYSWAQTIDRISVVTTRRKGIEAIRESGSGELEVTPSLNKAGNTDAVRRTLKSVTEIQGYQKEWARSNTAASLANQLKKSGIPEGSKDKVEQADDEKSKKITIELLPQIVQKLMEAKKSGGDYSAALIEAQKDIQTGLRTILGDKKLLFRGNLHTIADHLAQMAFVQNPQISGGELTQFIQQKMQGRTVQLANLESESHTKIISDREKKMATGGSKISAFVADTSSIAAAIGTYIAVSGVSKLGGVILGSGVGAGLRTYQQMKREQNFRKNALNRGDDTTVENAVNKKFAGKLLAEKETSTGEKLAMRVGEYESKAVELLSMLLNASPDKKPEMIDEVAKLYQETAARIAVGTKIKSDLIQTDGLGDKNLRFKLLQYQSLMKMAIGDEAIQAKQSYYDEMEQEILAANKLSKSETESMIRKEVLKNGSKAMFFSGAFTAAATVLHNISTGQPPIATAGTELQVSNQHPSATEHLQQVSGQSPQPQLRPQTHIERQAWSGLDAEKNIAKLSGYKNIDPNIVGLVHPDIREQQLYINAHNPSSTMIDLRQMMSQTNGKLHILLTIAGKSNQNAIDIPVDSDGVVHFDKEPLLSLMRERNFGTLSIAREVPGDLPNSFEVLSSIKGTEGGFNGSYNVSVTEQIEIEPIAPTQPQLPPVQTSPNQAPPVTNPNPDISTPPPGSLVQQAQSLLSKFGEGVKKFDSTVIPVPAWVTQQYGLSKTADTLAPTGTPQQRLEALKKGEPLPEPVKPSELKKVQEQKQLQTKKLVQKGQILIALRNEKLGKLFSPKQLDDLTPAQTEKLEAYLDNILSNEDTNYAEKVEKLKEKLDETTTRLLGLLDTSAKKNLAKSTIDPELTQQFLLSAISPDSDPNSEAVQKKFAEILATVFMAHRIEIANMKPRATTDISTPAEAQTNQRLADIISNAKEKKEAENKSSWQIKIGDALKNIEIENSDAIIVGGSAPVGLSELQDQAEAKIQEIDGAQPESKPEVSEPKPEEQQKESVAKTEEPQPEDIPTEQSENTEPEPQTESKKSIDSEKKEVKKSSGLPSSIYKDAENGDKKSQNIITMYDALQENTEYVEKLEKIVTREITALKQFSQQNFNGKFVSDAVKWYSEQVRLAYLTEIYAVYERNKDPKVAAEVVELLFKNEHFGTEESANAVHKSLINAKSIIIVDSAKKSQIMQKYVFEAISEYAKLQESSDQSQDGEKSKTLLQASADLKTDFVAGVDSHRVNILEATVFKINGGTQESETFNQVEENPEITTGKTQNIISNTINIEKDLVAKIGAVLPDTLSTFSAKIESLIDPEYTDYNTDQLNTILAEFELKATILNNKLDEPNLKTEIIEKELQSYTLEISKTVAQIEAINLIELLTEQNGHIELYNEKATNTNKLKGVKEKSEIQSSIASHIEKIYSDLDKISFKSNELAFKTAIRNKLHKFTESDGFGDDTGKLTEKAGLVLKFAEEYDDTLAEISDIISEIVEQQSVDNTVSIHDKIEESANLVFELDGKAEVFVPSAQHQKIIFEGLPEKTRNENTPLAIKLKDFFVSFSTLHSSVLKMMREEISEKLMKTYSEKLGLNIEEIIDKKVIMQNVNYAIVEEISQIPSLFVVPAPAELDVETHLDLFKDTNDEVGKLAINKILRLVLPKIQDEFDTLKPEFKEKLINTITANNNKMIEDTIAEMNSRHLDSLTVKDFLDHLNNSKMPSVGKTNPYSQVLRRLVATILN